MWSSAQSGLIIKSTTADCVCVCVCDGQLWKAILCTQGAEIYVGGKLNIIPLYGRRVTRHSLYDGRLFLNVTSLKEALLKASHNV